MGSIALRRRSHTNSARRSRSSGARSACCAPPGADPNAIEFLSHETDRLRALTDELLAIAEGERR